MLKKTTLTAAAVGVSLFAGNALADHDFSWKNLMLASAKLNSSFDYETYVDSYMREYRSPVWKKYRNDEFQMHTKRKETIGMMKNEIEGFDLEEEFVINTGIDFGKYNFDAEEFPIDGVSPKSYFTQSNHAGEFPYRYKVRFSNTAIFGNLEMNPEDAQAFVESRKNRYGNVDRELAAQLKFKIVERESQDMLVAEFTEVTLYEDNQFTKELTTFK